jgi:hypothetical protein
MDLIILFILAVGIILITLSWSRYNLKCPKQEIVYKYIPKHPLDVQLGSENFPSDIYKDMFVKSSPWIGGFEMGIGKTYSQISGNIVEEKK